MQSTQEDYSYRKALFECQAGFDAKPSLMMNLITHWMNPKTNNIIVFKYKKIRV